MKLPYFGPKIRLLFTDFFGSGFGSGFLSGSETFISVFWIGSGSGQKIGSFQIRIRKTVSDPHWFNADPDAAFSLKRIRILVKQ
jgi:hypothetical protein